MVLGVAKMTSGFGPCCQAYRYPNKAVCVMPCSWYIAQKKTLAIRQKRVGPRVVILVAHFLLRIKE